MDSLSLYKYTRCKTRYNINKKRAMRSFWLERNILEYAAGLALFEISVVLDYCKKTRSQRFCRERQASSSRRYDIPVGDSPHAVTHHCSSNNTDSSNYSVLSHCLAHGLIQ